MKWFVKMRGSSLVITLLFISRTHGQWVVPGWFSLWPGGFHSREGKVSPLLYNNVLSNKLGQGSFHSIYIIVQRDSEKHDRQGSFLSCFITYMPVERTIGKTFPKVGSKSFIDFLVTLFFLMLYIWYNY